MRSHKVWSEQKSTPLKSIKREKVIAIKNDKNVTTHKFYARSKTRCDKHTSQINLCTNPKSAVQSKKALVTKTNNMTGKIIKAKNNPKTYCPKQQDS